MQDVRVDCFFTGTGEKSEERLMLFLPKVENTTKALFNTKTHSYNLPPIETSLFGRRCYAVLRRHLEEQLRKKNKNLSDLNLKNLSDSLQRTYGLSFAAKKKSGIFTSWNKRYALTPNAVCLSQHPLPFLTPAAQLDQVDDLMQTIESFKDEHDFYEYYSYDIETTRLSEISDLEKRHQKALQKRHLIETDLENVQAEIKKARADLILVKGRSTESKEKRAHIGSYTDRLKKREAEFKKALIVQTALMKKEDAVYKKLASHYIDEQNPLQERIELLKNKLDLLQRNLHEIHSGHPLGRDHLSQAEMRKSLFHFTSQLLYKSGEMGSEIEEERTLYLKKMAKLLIESPEFFHVLENLEEVGLDPLWKGFLLEIRPILTQAREMLLDLELQSDGTFLNSDLSSELMPALDPLRARISSFVSGFPLSSVSSELRMPPVAGSSFMHLDTLIYYYWETIESASTRRKMLASYLKSFENIDPNNEDRLIGFLEGAGPTLHKILQADFIHMEGRLKDRIQGFKHRLPSMDNDDTQELLDREFN